MSIPFHLMDSKIPEKEAIRRMQAWRRDTQRLTSYAAIAGLLGGIALIVIALIKSL